MAHLHDSMIEPQIEGLFDTLGSKFSLCTVAAGRARDINAYFGQLGGGVGTMIPPQVNSVARKPLSIAFEELAAGSVVPIAKSELEEPEADAEAGSEEEAAAS